MNPKDANAPSTVASSRGVDRLELNGDRHDIHNVIRACKTAKGNGNRLELDFSHVARTWPNWLTPIAAVIQHYKGGGLPIAITGEQHYLSRTAFRNPVEASRENLNSQRVDGTVWVYFGEDQAQNLANSLVALIQKSVELAEGVLQSLNFCLYEVLDNVFQHSRQDCGFFMAILTNGRTRLALAIADTGIGVFNSFRPSRHNPVTHNDALTLAIQEGVTSTGDKRGNGLYALHRTVEQNQGSLELTSGYGHLRIKNETVTCNDFRGDPMIDEVHHGLYVDWQIDLKHPVSLNDALNMRVVNERLEQFESDDGDDYVVKVNEYEGGTGSRKAAQQLRVYIQNIIVMGARHMTLDFDGAVVVSASFADEVIGKLAEDYGAIGFFKTFTLANMNPTIEALLNRAIGIRISTQPPAAITREPPARSWQSNNPKRP